MKSQSGDGYPQKKIEIVITSNIEGQQKTPTYTDLSLLLVASRIMKQCICVVKVLSLGCFVQQL